MEENELGMAGGVREYPVKVSQLRVRFESSSSKEFSAMAGFWSLWWTMCGGCSSWERRKVLLLNCWKDDDDAKPLGMGTLISLL